MSIALRYHQTAPPSAPDEAYWATLLAQDELEVADVRSSEESSWSQSEAFQRIGWADGFAGTSRDWAYAEQLYEQDGSVLLAVVGCNKGGLLVEWESLRGFVPSSQLLDHHQPAHIEKYIGRTLELRIIEINPAQNRLIFSERAAQVSAGTRANLFHNLIPHHHCQGVVTNVCDFGVFVDLGGVEGLIHISELSWGRVEHPQEVVRRGQTVQVYIMDVSPERGRIALSLKRLTPDPWLAVESRYCVGQEVESVITSVVDFGAFAALEKGLEGLIHISELAEGQFLHPRNVVQEGQTVRVRILNINAVARRIGLSLRHPSNPNS